MNKSKEERYNKLYMDVALRVSQMSHCKRKKVGAILVKEDRIISIGWNGTPSGFDNCCEDEEGNTKVEVLHAESNLITKLARSNESGKDGTLYVTLSPCTQCAKLIYQIGIKKVYYYEPYRDLDGVRLLRELGIEVIELNY